MIDLNKLAAELHEAAVEKGFWSVDNAKEKHVAKWRGELGEVIQADRMGMMYEVERDGAKPEGVAAELADFVMMALDLFAVVDDGDAFDVIGERKYTEKYTEKIETAQLYTLVNSLYTAAEMITCHSNERTFTGMVFCVRAPEIWLKARGYDLWELIREKMAYNKSRPALHGRAY